MRRFLPPLAALFLVSVSASAQVAGRGSVGVGQVWHGPIAGAVIAAGQERLSQLGSPSLARLGLSNDEGRPAIMEHEALMPLVQELIDQRQTAESLAAMPQEQRLAAIAQASRSLESAADLALEESITAWSDSERQGTMAAQGRLRKARLLRLYLRPSRLEALDQVQKASEAFGRARKGATEQFLNELPSKLAAGTFDARTLVSGDKAGRWRAADEDPGSVHLNLSGLLEARVQRMGLAPKGPWTLKETALLRAVAGDPELGSELTGREKDRLKNELSALDASAHEALREPALQAALGRFQGRHKPRVQDVLAVERYYNRSVNAAAGAGDDTSWLRVIAGVQTGGNGLPGWEELKAARARLLQRNLQIADSALHLAFIAGLIAAALASLLFAMAEAGVFGATALAFLGIGAVHHRLARTLKAGVRELLETEMNSLIRDKKWF